MPFSDVHLQLHSIRAADLHAEAAAYRSSSPATRWQTRLGRLLVEYGLRLVNRPARVRLGPV